jgi:hypothetical protein
MSSKTKNYHLVEGEWKSFVFRRISRSDYRRVFNHINEYFLKEEPTCTLLGYTETFSKQMEIIITGLLDQNLSFLAESKESGEVRIKLKMRD